MVIEPDPNDPCKVTVRCSILSPLCVHYKVTRPKFAWYLWDGDIPSKYLNNVPTRKKVPPAYWQKKYMNGFKGLLK